MRNKKIFVVYLIAIGFASCSTKRNVVGTYRSKFAEIGMFSTTLILQPDTTFTYRFRGDLISEQATGTYKIDGNKLLLTYNLTPLTDTTYSEFFRKIGKNLDSLKKETDFPRLFYLGSDKLYSSWLGGRKVRRAQTYSKRKKYLFFGSHYYKKKFYLKKIESASL